ncbi:daptide-type RiPP [Nonomuraea sp. NPDC049784]|uniref:daptide-type RiPP n=1 Tax=Nonomuraea sp. NPDC049784 TaxID=3154361 RepID=UPI0033FC4D7F
MESMTDLPLELGMQELESMEAPFWGTFFGVATGVSVVTIVGSAISYGVSAVVTVIST